MLNKLKSVTDIMKVLGPVYGAMSVIFALIGYFMIEMYKTNIAHSISDAFPSQFQITLFFFIALFAAVFILMIATYQTIALQSAKSESM